MRKRRRSRRAKSKTIWIQKTRPSKKRSRSKRKRSRSRGKKSSNGFVIKRLEERTQTKRFVGLSPYIPRPIFGAFRLMISGPSGSGKTSILIRLLQAYHPMFNIVVFAPNVQQFEDNMKFTVYDSIQDFSVKKMMKLYKKHVAHNRKYKQYTIFVFDDVIRKLNASPDFLEILRNGRKEGISFAIIAQRYNEVTTKIKQEMTDVVMLTGDERQLRDLAGYFSLDKKKVVSAWVNHISPRPRSFMYFSKYPYGRAMREFTSRQLVPKRSRSRRSRRRRSRRRRSRR